MASAAAEGLGLQAMARDLGVEIKPHLHVDASAAVGIAQRKGLGRARRIDTQALWIQQNVKDKVIELRKVRGEIKPADLFTKFLLSKNRIDSLVRPFNCEYREGRPDAAPELRRANDDADAPDDDNETGIVDYSRGEIFANDNNMCN